MAMRPYINIPLLAPVRACGDPPALHKRTYALTLAIQVGDRHAPRLAMTLMTVSCRHISTLFESVKEVGATGLLPIRILSLRGA